MHDAQKTPSFRIYDKNKHKVDTLRSCFICEKEFTLDQFREIKYLTVRESPYTPVWDDTVFPDICELQKEERLKCVISFQKHTYGNFAVIKKARG